MRERPLFASVGTRRLVATATVVAIAALLLTFFRPELLLSQTTTTGGDTGAHIYTPWYVKNHLLPRGLISGWSPDWYAGFPVLHFYFPFVIAVQALAAYVIPYEIAFKIGTVLGTFFFPAAVALFLRLMRFRFPTPVVGAFLSLGFLFMDSFQIYGGNILSTLAGEYSFSFAFGMMLVFLGLAYRVATGDDGSPFLAAAALAVTALSHLVPVIVIVLSSPLLLSWAARRHGRRQALRRVGGMFGLAFALTAFWSLPFLVRLSYSADMHWFALEGWAPLLPRELWLPLGGTVLATLLAAARKDRRMLMLGVPALLGCALFVVVSPGGLFDGRIWNGRFLPFWYLGAFLGSAYLLGTTMPTVARLAWRRRASTVAVAMVAAIGVVTVAGILRDPGHVDDWVRHNYAGYESQPAYPTFETLMSSIERLPQGRIMWEPSPDLAAFGTPIAPMAIPYWTRRPVMEGIYFESSITTPFHFLTAAEIAEQPSNPIPSLPYHDFDMERGLRHMQVLGVSHFLAFSEQARRAASATPGLDRVDDVGRFSLFALDSPGQIVVPRFEPVVLESADWTAENVAWFSSVDELEVPLVRDGPEEWMRVPAFRAPLPRRPVEGGGRVLPARTGHDEIAFTTDAIGQPHWVKTSYFPNWRADGALGPYLASPSMMMVVPTQSEVRLTYRRTWAEWVGLGTTTAALLYLAVSARHRWAYRRRSVSAAAPRDADGAGPADHGEPTPRRGWRHRLRPDGPPRGRASHSP